ncbi:hypothetical protein BU24DRAFT_411825 [Aaosphaeria arxii CBS 175.79]|uniref:Zn(2)-C6 fungal-type domain-containing protein n=1 Tax=Aaosphaeria arxii CBS 175.79 TaxID=1450172 RepID=A0A6A5XJF5_9PLEO|nr:uncharacterized protein BU24DRAFT_411825 [Aaosphaeria arxii CBS 175.79]KAF2012454.1 hypothetical protein BU24DRAFT_411825 [Aaosphaeria arxii CBS 175.79]
MPRPKVTEARRQRVAKACIPCQEGKYKCDATMPCAQCAKRGRSESCEYSSLERSYGRHRRRIPKPLSSQQSPTLLSHESTLSAPPSNHSGQSPNLNSNVSKATVLEVNAPAVPQTLYDTRGRVVYLGESAAPAFVRQLQNLLEIEIGASADAGDPSKVTAIEEFPPEETEVLTTEDISNFDDLQELVDVYFTASCGILDIIDRHQVDKLLSSWRDGTLSDPGQTAVLLLIIAYAAQSRSGSPLDLKLTQYYYHHGRQIALLKLTEEPSIETVQTFVLISLYMLACSQRNGSFLNLGIAVSAAKSLGIHRDDINSTFPEDSQLRTRIWRSLRYQDLFFCGMMGRTPLTMTMDSTCGKPLDASIDPNNDRNQQLALMEAAKAFSILERIIDEIYTKGSPSLQHLEVIGQELQTSTSNIPPELRTVENPERPTQREVIRNTYVACSYYFSMMLLTRPFLLAVIRRQYEEASDMVVDRSQLDKNKTQDGTDIDQGALTSIESALHTIQLVHELLTANMLLGNMVLVIAWVFVASVTLCSAHAGRLGRMSDNEQAIQQAEAILKYFAKHTRQGRRYGRILQKLYSSARDYVKAIENKERHARSISMPELFSLSHVPRGQPTPPAHVPHDSHVKEDVEHQTDVAVIAPPGDPLYGNEYNLKSAHQESADTSCWMPPTTDNQWLTDSASIVNIIDLFTDSSYGSTGESMVGTAGPRANDQPGDYFNTPW